MTDDELDALLAPAEWDPNRCTVEQALERIVDEGRREKVAAAARDEHVPVANVMRVFTGLIGTSPKDQTVRRHRKRGCSCG